MSRFFGFVKKEFQHILRDVRTLVILLVLPVVMIVLFGFVVTTEIRDVEVGILDRSMDQASIRAIIKKASVFIADLLNKPESYVMVSIKPDTPLAFGGTHDPAAFVRLKSIGLPTDRCAEF